jgi:uncharacterized membrane protein
MWCVMKEPTEIQTEKLQSLKKLAATVYLCQVLSFIFAGLPILIGAIINFMNHDKVMGTWLQSHFDWQNPIWTF